MAWPGGKNGSGIYQRIINYMPPHETYMELFLGSGAVLRRKRPAKRNIGIDKSVVALKLACELAGDRSDVEWHFGCAFDCLTSGGQKFEIDQSTLIYLDPPFVMDTRKGRKLYDHELTDDDHKLLLSIIVELSCMVMISGYRNNIYDDVLKNWNRVDYRTMTRGGMVDESLWMNFSSPRELHDYSFLGVDFRDRERIKRKKKRWQKKITDMNRLERLAIMEVLLNVQG